MDHSKAWNSVALNEGKVVLFIDNDMLTLSLIHASHLVWHDLGFLRPKNSNLVLVKIRVVYERLPHLLGWRFA